MSSILPFLPSILGHKLDEAHFNNISGNLDDVVDRLQDLVDAQPKPFKFGETGSTSLSSNVADGVIIFAGAEVPYGYRGIVKDINVNFSTVAGTVRLVRLDAQNNIIADITRGIAASVSGIGEVVLEAAQKLGLAGQTAGAGSLGVYWSGVIQKVNYSYNG